MISQKGSKLQYQEREHLFQRIDLKILWVWEVWHPRSYTIWWYDINTLLSFYHGIGTSDWARLQACIIIPRKKRVHITQYNSITVLLYAAAFCYHSSEKHDIWNNASCFENVTHDVRYNGSENIPCEYYLTDMEKYCTLPKCITQWDFEVGM